MPEATIKGTILILEDETGIAQLERKRLERAHYAVMVAVSADEARQTLAGGGVDLMVLDYLLASELNGLEFYRSLRDEGMAVPSILVTGFSDESMLTQAIRAGIRDFLPKNADFLDYLVPTVERVLQQVQVEKQLDEERAKVFREQAARAEAEAERKALAEEDRRKDEFLAMLAHELRNPLSAISGAVQLAQASPSKEHAAWSNEVITRQVKHLSHLIDDLLDVSRIRLGKIQLRKQALDVSETIPRVVETVRPLIEKKRHALTVTIAPGPLRLAADPTRLEQILVNLLTNAAKYTDEGGKIHLFAGREGDSIVFRVTDTGAGIAPEMLPRIFDLFIQVEGTLDRSQGGLGIGLTLVRKLVDMHDGQVKVTSRGLGLGSEFEVLLPALNDAATLPSLGAKSYPWPDSRRGPRRVLVVDDNTDAARGLARFLKLGGHDVAIAHEGSEAIVAARKHKPEVVLLDIGLPGMDGFQVASTLRAEDCCRNALIIAISGYGQQEDRRRSSEAGFDHHLVKPIDYDALLTLIAASARVPK